MIVVVMVVVELIILGVATSLEAQKLARFFFGRSCSRVRDTLRMSEGAFQGASCRCQRTRL
jgi:hypothetical protein